MGGDNLAHLFIWSNMNRQEFTDKYGNLDIIDCLVLWISMMEDLTERVANLEKRVDKHVNYALGHMLGAY